MSETAPQGKMDFDSDFGTESNKSLKRPWVAFFHFFFRISALLVYLFGTTFSGSFIGVFVTVILLLSLDFWTVKNVSGRIMVSYYNFLCSKFHPDRMTKFHVVIFILKCLILGWFTLVELYQ